MTWMQRLLGPVLGSALTGLSRRSLPRVDGTLCLEGLERPVEVLRDRWGVPHIYAGNLPDLMFAQGYVHAQDRLWQMDFQRRMVAGRLAEVLGAVAIPLDRWFRVLGMRRVAEQEPALLSEEAQAGIEAYAAGVNACADRSRLGLEFTVLSYSPEPWTVADTLSWAKMMAWTLSVNWEAELLRAQLVARLGPELVAELEPRRSEDWPLIVPPGVEYSAIGDAALRRAQDARPLSGPGPQAGLGSNNWVLSGARTASGAPLLANDMHLGLTAPAVWYENHLVGAGLTLTGVTFPGIPCVVAGHNGHVAWGFTNGFPDVQDLYMEHIRRTEQGLVQYEFRGEWLDAQVIQEEIHVKGGHVVTEEVIVTRHGPLINSLAADLAGEQPLALRWTALEPDRVVESVFQVARARTCAEFREALRPWGTPAQNTVYADTQGNIGYSLPGRVPIRARGDGRMPVPGWSGEYEWTGYVPFDELPHLYNPPQGYIATANNRVTDQGYPYCLGTDHCVNDRAQRIVELIEAQTQHDVASTQRMQFDQVALLALSICRSIGEALAAETPVGEAPGREAPGGETLASGTLGDDEELAAPVRLLREWDGELGVDSPAAAVYQVFLRQISALLLQDKLGDLTVRYMGQGPTPVLAEGTIFAHRSLEWLEETLQQPDSRWFDLGHGEGRAECIRLALRQSVDFLKSKLGPRVEDWAWGKLHTVTFRHSVGRAWPFDRVFNRGPYPVGGDTSTIWATGANQQDLNSDSVTGPPFRFIADLGDLRNSWGLLAPGQSGHPGSPHYDDGAQVWFSAAGYHPLLWDREDVERETEARLRMEPDEMTNDQ